MKDDKKTKTTPVKPARPLTRKRKAFVQYLVDHPKASATEAVLATHGKEGKPPTYGSARMMASEILAQPSVQSELAKHSRDIENALLSVVNRWKDSDKVGEVSEAMTNARYLHDKIHGKATQQVNVKSMTITMSIDMTQTDDITTV